MAFLKNLFEYIYKAFRDHEVLHIKDVVSSSHCLLSSAIVIAMLGPNSHHGHIEKGEGV